MAAMSIILFIDILAQGGTADDCPVSVGCLRPPGGKNMGLCYIVNDPRFLGVP